MIFTIQTTFFWSLDQKPEEGIEAFPILVMSSYLQLYSQKGNSGNCTALTAGEHQVREGLRIPWVTLRLPTWIAIYRSHSLDMYYAKIWSRNRKTQALVTLTRISVLLWRKKWLVRLSTYSSIVRLSKNWQICSSDILCLFKWCK